MEENRVSFPCIRAPKQDKIRVFDFLIRTGSTACSEYRRQTGDARGMSSPIAAVDVVRSHDAANEFLCRVIELVGCFGTAKHSKVPWIPLFDRLAERRRDSAHGFIPGRRMMRTVLAYQRFGQAALHGLRHSVPTTRYENGSTFRMSRPFPGWLLLTQVLSRAIRNRPFYRRNFSSSKTV
jgi:hypothetical protein